MGAKDGSTVGPNEEVGQLRIAFGAATATTLEPTSEERLRRNLERERKRNVINITQLA